VGIILLFFSLKEGSFWDTILVSAVAGLTTGLIYFTWSLEASHQYSGAVTGETVFIYLALSFYNALWYGLFGAGYFVVRRSAKSSPAFFVLSTASLWVSWEWLYQHALPSFPWIIISPYTQWNDLYLLQWGSVGGIWIISFIIAGFSAAVYMAVVRRSKKIFGIAAAVMVLIYVSGYYMYSASRTEAGRPVRFSLIQENIAAKERWNQSFADSLAHVLIRLNEEAVAQRPQIIAWTETAVPWTFRTDDALVNRVLSITYPTGASHLMGMLTQADAKGDVYNSIYYINPDGAITGRYDKRQLLTFLEKPLFSSGWILPFRQSRYDNILPGKRRNVIATKYGIVGTMICNESLSPECATEAVDNGAQMLFVASNDSWFFHSVLNEAHLALTRMRAIETRRDIVLDANRGYAGVIKASGNLHLMSPSVAPRTLPERAFLRDGRTIYSEFPNAVIYAALSIGAFGFYSSLRHTKRSK